MKTYFNKYSVGMILAVPIKILGKNDVTELSAHKFIVTDTFKDMLLKVVEIKRNLARVKRLVVVTKYVE